MSYVIDVSSNNGPYVPWQGLRDQHNIHGGIVKATEGISYKNPTFKRHWQILRQLGMQRGAYLWAHPGYSATQTMDYFNAFVKQAGGFQPRECVFIDFEQNDGFDRAKCDAWLMEAEKHEAVVEHSLTLGIYSGDWFFRSQLGISKGPWDHYALWVADYGRPPTITNWYGHQFTDSFDGKYDCSYFPRGLTPLPPAHTVPVVGPQEPRMTPALWRVTEQFVHTHYAPQYREHMWTILTSHPRDAYAVLKSHKLI